MDCIKRSLQVFNFLFFVLIISWNLHAYVSDTHSVSTAERFRADISFMVVDLKYRPGFVKILEFGEGHRSGFNGHSVLYTGEGRILPKFWKYIKQFNRPIWYVGARLAGVFDDDREVEDPLLSKIRRISRFSLLETDSLFIAAHQEKDDSFDSNNFTRIHDFKGIIISRAIKTAHLTAKYEHHSRENCKKCLAIKAFRSNYSDFMLLDDATCLYAANKEYADLLFQDAALQSYRPRAKSYSKVYTPELASLIRKDIGSDRVVIKPLASSHGKGVILVESEKLDSVLEKILQKKDEPENESKQSQGYWTRDRSERFIVQSYEPSKLITVQGKQYDATMRVAFALHHDDGKICLTFFGAYWKLPCLSIHEVGSLTSKAKSSINRNRSYYSAKVTPDDLTDVKNILKNILPKLYVKMLLNKRDYPHF